MTSEKFLCLGFNSSKNLLLTLANVVLAVLVSELLLIPAFLRNLLGWFLAVDRVRADGGVTFLVHVLDLFE